MKVIAGVIGGGESPIKNFEVAWILFNSQILA